MKCRQIPRESSLCAQRFENLASVFRLVAFYVPPHRQKNHLGITYELLVDIFYFGKMQRNIATKNYL